jgi:hypothetical protein
MATRSGPRAAQSLVSGRAYGGIPDKVKLLVEIDPRLLGLAEQYHICVRKGRGGQCVGDWITDRLIDAIKEKRRLAEEIKEGIEYRKDAVFPPVFPGVNGFIPGGGGDPFRGFNED